MKYLFGPVPSRRLGFSLGIDLIPFKTCTYDCIYCELGHTTHLKFEPAVYVSANEIKAELDTFFADPHHPPVDFITLGGSGEPTLNSNLAQIVEIVKNLNKAPLAVLTNGSLLWREEIASALLKADVVLPSLDTVFTKTWEKINRPHPLLKLETIINGLKGFRRKYKGQIWLEILFVKGVNDTEVEIEALHKVLEEISPEKIQLNTVVRPPAERGVEPLTKRDLEEIKEKLGPKAEIVVDFKSSFEEKPELSDLKEKIIALLSRRPCILEDIAHALGVHFNTVIKMMNGLQKENLVDTYLHNGKRYYLIRKGER
mgnify:CR=1 FL=1